MILQLAGVHLDLRIVGGVLVEVGEQDGLAVGGLDVLARAAVAVSTGADLVVEGTVYFVGFGAEDGGEVVGHVEGVCGWQRRVRLRIGLGGALKYILAEVKSGDLLKL